MLSKAILNTQYLVKNILKLYIFTLFTIICLGIICYFDFSIYVQKFDFTNVLLAIATIFATILALVFTLSLIPIQNAAQMWSFSILKIYKKDKQTFWTFFIFGLFTLFFIVLTIFEKKISDFLLFSFIVLSFSVILDVLRGYHAHVVSLFDPESILNKIKLQAFETIDYLDTTAKKVAKYNYLLLDKDKKIDIKILEGKAYKTLPNYPQAINYWLRDLGEVYQKSISRNDLAVSKQSVLTMQEVMKYYVEKRKGNIYFYTVMTGLLPIQEADIDREVIEPFYELLIDLFEVSIKQSSENSALEIIEIYKNIAIYLTNINPKLSSKSINYAMECIKHSQSANSIEIPFQASQIFFEISNAIGDKNLDYQDVDSHIMKAIEQIVLYLYIKNRPELSEYSTKYLMKLNKSDDDFIERLKRIMEIVEGFVPFALLSEQNKGRISGYIPLSEVYSLTCDYSIGNIYEYAVALCKVDKKREFHNPYQVLIDILDIYWRHIRAIAEKYDIQNSFMIHEIDQTIKHIAGINLELYKSPIRDKENDLEELNEKFIWLMSFYWVAFENKQMFNEYFCRKVVETLKEIAIEYLEQDLIEVTENAIDNIKSVISSIFKISNNPYLINGLLEQIVEIKNLSEKNGKHKSISEKCGNILNQYENKENE